MPWESILQVKAAAGQGNAEAQFLLGLQYKAGDGVDKDRNEAVKWLRKSAESGYVEAQYALGDFYAGLDPTDELADQREAEKWLQAAATQGVANAQTRLDLLQARAVSAVRPPAEATGGLLKQVEVMEEPAVTIHWSELLAGLRGAAALVVRGFLLENGIYVERDLAAAADAYRGAALLGDTAARHRLAAMYEEGRGVIKDAAAAQVWQRLAVGAGPEAALAALLKEQNPGAGPKPDPAEQARWSALLSGLRDADAFLVRGFVLEHGIHVSRDGSAAAENYRLALARGDARARLLLVRSENERRNATQAEGEARGNAASPPTPKPGAK